MYYPKKDSPYPGRDDKFTVSSVSFTGNPPLAAHPSPNRPRRARRVLSVSSAAHIVPPMDRVRHQTTSTARYGSRKVISRPKWRRRHYYCRGWSVKLIGEFAHDGYARHILSPYAVETHQHVAHRSSARSSTDGWAVMVQYDINSGR